MEGMDGLEEVTPAYTKKMQTIADKCEEHEELNCHTAGYFFASVHDEHTKAFKIFERNCNRGFQPSCYLLAKYYMAGKPVKQDDVIAEKLLEKACSTASYAPACHTLGLLRLEEAEDVLLDKKKTFTSDERKSYEDTMKNGLNLLEMSCNSKKDAISCHYLGNYFLHPRSYYRDPAKAIKYLEPFCDAEDMQVCHDLAVLYKKGDGIPQDLKKFEYYKQKTLDIKSKNDGAVNKKMN